MNGDTKNILGYHEKFCLSCNVTDGGGPHVFNYPKIEIIGLPKKNETVDLSKFHPTAENSLKIFLK